MSLVMPSSPLDIPELLVNIFEQMADDKRSLAVCARVCKSWSERSLEVLWRGPIWASQLITVFPSELGDEHPHGFLKASFDPLRNQRFLTRLPSKEELARVQKYAELVQHLRFDESDALHPFFTARLSFPKLRRVDAQPAMDAEVVITVGPILGPDLEQAVLVMHDGGSDASDSESDDDEDDDEAEGPPGVSHFDSAANAILLDYTARSCPALRRLELCVGKTASPTFLSHLAPLKQTLESLAIHIENDRPRADRNPFPLNELYHLDGFVALRNLEVNCINTLPAEDIGSYPRPLDLPSLESFVAGSLPAADLPSLLYLQPTTIRSLVLLGIPVLKAPSRQLQEQSERVARAVCRFEELQELRWLNDESTEHIKHDRLGQALATPLRNLSKLHTLHLADMNLFMPESFVLSIPSFFPHLRDLAVAVRNMSDEHLANLSSRIPDLERLALAPWIKRSDDATALKDEAHVFEKMSHFGDLFPPGSVSRPTGAANLAQLVNDKSFASLFFPLSCVFKAAQPFMDHVLQTPFGSFKAAAMEGSPGADLGLDDEELDELDAALGDADEDETDDSDEETTSEEDSDEDGSGGEGAAGSGDETEGSWIDED